MSFTDEQIARITHAAARELQQILGDDQISPPWESFSTDQQDVVIAGVQAGRHGATPEALHEKWVAEKQAAGWTLGDVKDPVAKTHPLMVPFDQLPPGDQAKDYLFAGICTAMNAAADVKARAENEQLALQETAAAVQKLNAQNQPFGGAEPVFVQQAAEPPASMKES